MCLHVEVYLSIVIRILFVYLEDKTYDLFWSLLNNLIIILKWSSTIYKIKFFRFGFWDRCCVPCILMYSNISIFFTYKTTEIISAYVNKCSFLKKCWPKWSHPLDRPPPLMLIVFNRIRTQVYRFSFLFEFYSAK